MALRLVSHHNNLWGCDIIQRMQHPVHDEVFMEEALAAIRRAMVDEEAGEMTLAPTAEPGTSHDKIEAKRASEAGLLSREATASVGSAFNTLTETVKKHQPTLRGRGSGSAPSHAEDMAGQELAPRGRANGPGRNRTGCSRMMRR